MTTSVRIWPYRRLLCLLPGNSLPRPYDVNDTHSTSFYISFLEWLNKNIYSEFKYKMQKDRIIFLINLTDLKYKSARNAEKNLRAFSDIFTGPHLLNKILPYRLWQALFDIKRKKRLQILKVDRFQHEITTSFGEKNLIFNN